MITVNTSLENSITVSASTEHLSSVRNFVAEKAHHFGFNERSIDEIRLAVDEAFTNVVKHAYKYDESQPILVSVGAVNDEFWVAIADDGHAFDPSKYIVPDIEARIKEKRGGGVGVYLIKKLMDSVEYSTIGSRNQIKMIKKL